MRSTKAQLLEAELMNSTPEHVYAWLKDRAEQSDEESYSGDEELEGALLSRGSALIDLGLARYGCSAAVVRKLLSDKRLRGAGNVHILGGSDQTSFNPTHLLRLAALSNCALMKHRGLLERMPQLLFSDDVLSSDLGPIREFVETAGPDEVLALFQNPTIHGEVLAKLYEKESPFDALSEERWQYLVMTTIGNLRLRAEYVGPMDGWAEYMHGRVFNEAWALAERVPTTPRWADILVRLLEETSPECFSIKDKTAVIQRWLIVGSSAETAKQPDTLRDSCYENGYLDDFGTVRLVLTKLLTDSEIQDLRSHDDIAMRCAFYKYGSPTRQELMDAYSREPKFLLNYALRNDAVWKRSETREALQELCWVAAKPDSDLSFPNAYQGHSDRLESEHPEWFREEHDVQQEEQHPLESLNAALKTLEAGQTGMLSQITALRVRMTVLFWITCIVLGFLILSRRW
jgi:hypothetical protein